MLRKHWKHFIRYQSPAILWAVTIFLLSSIPSRKIPKFQFLISLDKLGHAAIFFIFGLLIYRALEPGRPSGMIEWKRMLFALALVVLYGAVDEIHQGYVPGRTVDLYDLLADTVGGILSILVVYIVARKRQNRSRHAL